MPLNKETKPNLNNNTNYTAITKTVIKGPFTKVFSHGSNKSRWTHPQIIELNMFTVVINIVKIN